MKAKKSLCVECDRAVRVYVPKGDAADRYVIVNHRDKLGDWCCGGRAPVRVFLSDARAREEKRLSRDHGSLALCRQRCMCKSSGPSTAIPSPAGR